jgi:hypothetical protein
LAIKNLLSETTKTNFSRLEALVRKRESLLKFIYERRKGEVSLEPTSNGDLYNNNRLRKPSSLPFLS